jgi:AcrR family transcriptional regulator
MNRFAIRRKHTEERLIKAALGLFVRQGYHGTSVQEITQAAGVTKGALYGHFQSKGELLLRIIKEFEINFIDEMIRTSQARQGDAWDKLQAIVSFNSAFAAQNPDLCVFLTFLATELKADVEFEKVLKDVYRKYRGFISSLIRQGQAEGRFAPLLDPDLTALIFMGLHDGILHQWALNQNEVDGKHYVRTFRQILFEGLRAR